MLRRVVLKINPLKKKYWHPRYYVYPRKSVEFYTFAYLHVFEVVLQLKRIQKQGHIKYTTGRQSRGIFKAPCCLPSSSITSPHLPNPICCINISQTSFTYNDAPTIVIDSRHFWSHSLKSHSPILWVSGAHVALRSCTALVVEMKANLLIPQKMHAHASSWMQPQLNKVP